VRVNVVNVIILLTLVGLYDVLWRTL